MRRHNDHPDQMALTFGQNAEIERMVEARVAIRAEADALRWRFRLIVIETLLLSILVLVSGLLLDQPKMVVARAALVVGAACFASGILLIGLSGAASRMMARYRRWRQR